MSSNTEKLGVEEALRKSRDDLGRKVEERTVELREAKEEVVRAHAATSLQISDYVTKEV